MKKVIAIVMTLALLSTVPVYADVDVSIEIWMLC